MRRLAGLAVCLTVLSVVLYAATTDADSYVLRDGDITYMLGKGMSESRLKAIQHDFGEHFLWARRNGRVYVATDAKTRTAALNVLQRNVQRGPVTEKRMAEVIDAAIRGGTARLIRP